MILLSDGYLANGAEPWRLPDVADLPDISVPFATEPNHDGEFWPYLRDPETLARPWAIPGTPGLEHRIGGLEKADGTGNISYDPDNHERMVRLRAAKVAGIAKDIPLVEVDDPDPGPTSWCSGGDRTYGVIAAAVPAPAGRAARVAHAHLTHLNPFPSEPRRGARPVPQGARAGDEPGPALQAGAGRVPGRRPVVHQGPGPALPGRRDRSSSSGPSST